MIPKLIHQIWHSSTYDSAIGSPASWKALNPDWDYRLWTDAELEDFVAARFPDLLDLYRSYPSMVQRSDLGRYLLLCRHGGVYADMDTECLASFDAIAGEERVILCEEPPPHRDHPLVFGENRCYFSGTMASPAGHPFWRYVIDRVRTCRHAAPKDVLLSTGPLVLSSAVRSWPSQSDLSLNSCHLFTPLDRDGGETAEEMSGDHAALRLSRHFWAGAWMSDEPEPRWSRIKGQMRKWRALATRPEQLAFETAMSGIDRDALLATPPACDPSDPPAVAVFVPVKDGAPFIERHFELLMSLDYPGDKLRLVYCEGDSVDNSRAMLETFRDRHRDRFRDITIMDYSTGLRIRRKRRWWPKYQRKRRSALAKVRNALVDRGLKDDEWVLWLDIDVCDFAPGILKELLATGAKIVTPDCVKEHGGPSFDHNAYLDFGEPRQSLYYRHLINGLFHPPATYPHRLLLHDLRCFDEVPLTGVGGTMLLVHASVYRAGLRFPEIPYKDLLETEGFGVLANDAGLSPLGLPNTEIVHVDS